MKRYKMKKSEGHFPMNISQELMEQLERHEGWRARPYKDTTGHITIGFGTNLSAGISRHEGIHLMVNRLVKKKNDIAINFPFTKKLGEIRFDVLTNMCYNMGIGRLKRFKRMWKAIENHDFEKASKEMLKSKWAKQVKGRAKELARQMRDNRRKP
jgi:lysozyme